MAFGSDIMITVGMGVDESQVTRTLANLTSKANSALTKGINANAFIEPLGRISGKANEFQKSLAASNARVIAFGASVGTIHLMKEAFDTLVESTIGVQKSLADINVSLNLSQNDLKNFSKQLFEIANNTGTTFKEASEAALEFSRHGLNVEEALKRTAAALTLSKISGMDYKDSVIAITAGMNSFTKEAHTAEDIVNKLTAVGTKYAASAADLAEGLSRVGAVANDANVSLDQTLALIASAQQITARGGNVLSNAFKSIFTRLQRPEVLDDLASVGIVVRDTAGKVRPLIDILKSLGQTYGELSSTQKSFVSEAVGGVYQVNTLKAVLSDLGSGVSLYDRALKTASESSGIADEKLKQLNSTIASSLIRTMNDLTQASSNIGTALFGNSLTSGIDGIRSLINMIGNLHDATKNQEGSGPERVIGNTISGLTKGVGNALSGPGLQYGIKIFLQLFTRLEKFIIDSIKDLDNVTSKVKQRADIESNVVSWLLKEDDIMKKILTGQLSINEASAIYLANVQNSVSTLSSAQALAGNMSAGLAKSIHIEHPSSFGRGYVPNLNTGAGNNEISEARKGGYQAGKVMNTTINNGIQRIPAVINSKETITTVKDGNGYSYDFVNPPKGSPAGNAHEREVENRYGFSPYKADGFVPNLATPEQIQKLNKMGIDVDLILQGGSSKITRADFDSIPNQFIEAGLKNFGDTNQHGSLVAYLRSIAAKSSKSELPQLSYSPLKNYLRGFIGKPQFPQFKTSEDLKPLLESLTGGSHVDEAAQMKLDAATTLNPEDVQKVLSHYGKDFVHIAAYTSSSNLTVPKDQPNLTQELEVGGRNYKVPTPFYAHQTALQAYGPLNEKMAEFGKTLGVKNPKAMSPSRYGHVYGEFINEMLQQFFEEQGIKSSENNASLDVEGYHPAITQFINRKAPFAGAELKASFEQILGDSPKIFRTLAGEPGSGKNPYKLSGPVSPVPPLVGIRRFDPNKGSIGILDADNFKKVSTSRNDFNSLVYGAVATGKALKTHYGPMGSGKTTTAEQMAQKSGGGFVSGHADLNNYDQFILNATNLGETDKKTSSAVGDLNTGVFGLALAASSSIEGFYHDSPISMMEAVARRARNAGEAGIGSQRIAFKSALSADVKPPISPASWSAYGQRMSEFQKRFGDRFKYHQYGKGFVPNLGIKKIVRDGDWRKGIDFDDYSIYKKNTASTVKDFELQTPHGSHLTFSKKDDKFKLDYVRSHHKGDGTFLIKKLAGFAKNRQGIIESTNLVPQRVSNISKDTDIYSVFPQIKMREKAGLENTSGEADIENGGKLFDFKNLTQLKKWYKKLSADDKPYVSISNLVNKFGKGFIPNLSSNDSDWIKNHSIQQARNMGIDIESMQNKGFKYLGVGAQSIVMTTPSGNSAMKFEYRAERQEGYSKKLKRTNDANKTFKLAGVPIISPPVKLIKYQGKEALLQKKIDGITLGKFLNDKDYSHYEGGRTSLQQDFLSVIDKIGDGHNPNINDIRKKNKLAYHYLDTASAENFVVPNKNTGALKELLSKVKNKSELETVWPMSGINIAAIDLAKGFVPNLYNPFEDALKAENKATGGNAKLSRSSKLITSMNPMGFAAIDKRSQKNADEAIAQHSSLGQNMSEIKTARTYGRGFVPNLADTFSGNNVATSIMLGVASYGANLSGASKKMDEWKMKFPALSTIQEREVITIKQTIDEFGRLRNELAMSTKAQKEGRQFIVKEGGQPETFHKAEDLEAAFGPRKKVLQSVYDNYKEKETNNREYLGKVGLRSAIGINIGGGLASQAAGNVSPNLQASIEEFTSGLSASAQSLIAFPNKIGKALAIGFGVGATVSGFDTFYKGLADSRKEFELLQSRTQNITIQLNNLTQTLVSYDNHLVDANVSTETLIREQKKIAEITAQLENIPEQGKLPGGGSIALKVASQPTTAGKLAAIEEYNTQLDRQKESKAATLGLQEYVGNRSFMGWSPNPVGYSNNFQKTELGQTLQNVASTSIAPMSNNLKESLTEAMVQDEKAARANQGNNTGDNFNQILQSSQEAGAEELRQVLASLKQVGGDKTSEAVLSKIKINLGSEAVFKSPEILKSLDSLKAQVAKDQLSLDSSLRSYNNTLRRFVNEGSERANNALDIRAVSTRQSYLGSRTQVAQRQQTSALLNLQYGPATVKTYDTETEDIKTEGERKQKTSEIQSKLTETIAGRLTSNFDAELSQLKELSKVTGGRNIPVSSAESYTIGKVQNINTGISSVVQEGNLNRFNDNGQFSPDKFIDEVGTKLGQQGVSPSNISDVKEWLKNSVNSAEILSDIRSSNNELVQVNQDALNQIELARVSLDGLKAEVKAKATIGLLGGEKSLESRESRNKLVGDITRGEALFAHGSTAEVRGQGAALVLQSMKAQNLPIDANEPTGHIKELQNAITEGIQAVQNQMTGRIDNSINRMEGSDSKAANFWNKKQQGYGAGKYNTALAQYRAEFKPEDAKIQGQSNSGIVSETTQVSAAFNDTLGSLTNFNNAIGNTVKLLNEALDDLSNTRQQIESNEAPAKKDVTKRIKRAEEYQTFRTQSDEAKQDEKNNNPLNALYNNVAGNIPSTSVVSSIVAAAVVSLITNKIKNRNTPQSGQTGILNEIPKSEFIFRKPTFRVGATEPIFGKNINPGQLIPKFKPAIQGPNISYEQRFDLLKKQEQKEIENFSTTQNLNKFKGQQISPIAIPTSQSPIITSTPITVPQLSEEGNLKLKRSLDRPLHLSPEELNKPFTHGGTTLTPNELAQAGIINIGQKEAGEITGVGLPAGKHPITYYSEEMKTEMLKRGVGLPAEKHPITYNTGQSAQTTRFTQAGKIPGHEDLKGLHKKEINERLKTISQEYVTTQPSLPVSSNPIVTSPVTETIPKSQKRVFSREYLAWMTGERRETIPKSQKRVFSREEYETITQSPSLKDTRGFNVSKYHIEKNTPFAQGSFTNPNTPEGKIAPTYKELTEAKILTPYGESEQPMHGMGPEHIQQGHRLNPKGVPSYEEYLNKSEGLAPKGGKLLSHAGVAGLALGIAGNATGNATLSTLGDVATIAGFVPDAYRGGKAALQFGKTAVGALGGVGLGSVGAVAGSVGLGATVGLTAGTYLNKARFAKRNDAIFKSSGLGDEEDVKTVNKMLESGKSQGDIQSYLQSHLNTVESQRKGVTGIFHTIAGEGKQREGFEESSKVLQELLRQLPDAIATRQSNKEQTTSDDKSNTLLKEILDAVKSNNNSISSKTATDNNIINVNIAIKDSDKVSDTADKVIMTIKGKLDELSRVVEQNSRNNGMTPNPSAVNRSS